MQKRNQSLYYSISRKCITQNIAKTKLHNIFIFIYLAQQASKFQKSPEKVISRNFFNIFCKILLVEMENIVPKEKLQEIVSFHSAKKNYRTF